MGYDGWLDWDGSELVNISRTVQLAEVLGIDTLWTNAASVAWIEAALSGADYSDITLAPWYDSGHPASAEFAGFVPLALSGLDDSTLQSDITEYITDGGSANKPRNTTLPIVASFAVIASTDRGADFGNRWLARRLRGAGTKALCSGAELTYFRYAQQGADPVPPKAHRRDVSTTRGISVTRKRITDCSATWWVSFTWTANDPFEYGEEIPQFAGLGGALTGPHIVASGSAVLTQESCPEYSYAPLYDPQFPALVAPPVVPDFYPDGWGIAVGTAFKRSWVKISPTEPSSLNLVPILNLTTTEEARSIRVSIWPGDANTTAQCGALFSAVLTYLPTSQQFFIDGEQQASYVWDGISPVVRRTDSLVYGPDATPIDWTAFNNSAGLLITLDAFAKAGGGYEGSDHIRASLALVPKSD